MREVKKYLLRFAIIMMIVLPFLMIAGEQAIKIAMYKISMVTVGIGISELIWAIGFKTVYGKTEELDVEKQRNVLVFRAILYAAIILGLTLGL